MTKEGACVHQVRCFSVTYRPERPVRDSSNLVDANAALEACSVVAGISVGFPLAPRPKAHAFRSSW
jgi:hypothetical protein